MLTVEHIIIPIKTIEDLTRSSKYKIILEAGTATVEYFEALPGDIRLMEKSQLIDASKDSSIIEKIIMEDDDFVYFGSKLTFTSEAIPCHIITQSESYLIASISWAFQKNSPYLALINFNLNKALESGIASQIMRQFMHVPDETTCSVSSYEQIYIENIFSAFLMLLFGIICACLLASTEAIWYHLKKGNGLVRDKCLDIPTNQNSRIQINVEIGKHQALVLIFST